MNKASNTSLKILLINDSISGFADVPPPLPRPPIAPIAPIPLAIFVRPAKSPPLAIFARSIIPPPFCSGFPEASALEAPLAKEARSSIFPEASALEAPDDNADAVSPSFPDDNSVVSGDTTSPISVADGD